MKKIFFIIFIFISIFLGAQNFQKIIPLSSDFYTLLDRIYLEQGFVEPSMARPWTQDEFSECLSRIDPTALSKAGKNIYNYLADSLKKERQISKKSRLAVSAGLETWLEYFLHIPVKSDPPVPLEDYIWMHGYEERKPVLNIPLQFWVADGLYMIADLSAKEEPMTVNSPETPEIVNNHFNWFDKDNPQIDLYFPSRAFSSAGAKSWNIQFGRDRLSWGNGTTGNMMLSDYSDYYDFLKFTAYSNIPQYSAGHSATGLQSLAEAFTKYWSFFKFSAVYAVMDHYLYDGSSITYKAFFGHRFEFVIFDRISFVVNESVVFGNQMPEFIRDINPLMVFHNWMIPERTNSLLSLELSVNPWRFFNIYGQIAMDEFATEYETERDGGGGPPIFGFLAGANGVIPIGRGYLGLFGEWAYTDPFLYNRRAAPYYYNVKRVWSLVTDQFEYIVKPIGYKYGSDAIVWYIGADYRLPGMFLLNTGLNYIIKGEKDYSSPYAPSPEDLTPTGTAEKKFIINLGGEYTPWPFLIIGTDLYFSYVNNAGHILNAVQKDFEWAVFIKVTI